MAIGLSTEVFRGLVSRLESPDAIAEDPYGLAKELSRLVNRGGGPAEKFPTDIQELLIRAREHRQHFGFAVSIIDSLLRERGLFPYLDPADLGVADRLAFELHRPLDLDESTVFHAAQARVYHALLSGKNIALSAPTSFGKSLIIDAIIAEHRHQKVAVIVPTIALIDETRRRLTRKFGDQYKIVTHVGQAAEERTIFILTPERVLECDGIDEVTFFAVDEFYKLDPEIEPDRSGALNEALYRLASTKAQFYLLGPNIDEVPSAFIEQFGCEFEHTDYATVSTEVVQLRVPTAERDEQLARIVKQFTAPGEPTLVYCQSPRSARRVARFLAEQRQPVDRPEITKAVDWVGREYHPEWGFVRALAACIGLHHGPMPRSLQQYVARAFNAGLLDVLVCTSTLIEGVNTTAKNVVVFDHHIGDEPLDYFTYQNIRGRSGRMGKHFVGRVFVFADPPLPTHLEVDVPVATQTNSAPDSLLIQLDFDALSPEARKRMQPYYDQELIPVPVLQQNHGIDPAAQLRLAEFLHQNADGLHPLLFWRSPVPTREQIDTVCELIFDHLVTRGRVPRGALSAPQLSFFVRRFSAVRDIRDLINAELKNQADRGRDVSADEAVETTLDFLRNWANYHFPRFLMTLSRIQETVYKDVDLPPGDYSAFATQIENYFLPAGIAALDEYGIPLQLGKKLQPLLGEAAEDLDLALAALPNLDFTHLELHPFEEELLLDALAAM